MARWYSSALEALSSATYNLFGDHLRIGAFIKNITSQFVPLRGIRAALAPGFVYETVDAPPTFGARFRFRF